MAEYLTDQRNAFHQVNTDARRTDLFFAVPTMQGSPLNPERTTSMPNARFFIPALAALIGLSLAATRPAAAQFIRFGTAQNISGASDVSTAGTPVSAYYFSGGSTSTTVNGVAFTPSQRTGGGNFSISVSGTGAQNNLNGGTTYGSSNAPYSNLPSTYQTLLGGAEHGDNGSAGAPVTYTQSGLKAGEIYQVQYFVNDSRSLASSRTDAITSAGGNSQTLKFNTTGADGGLGQYAVGTFTAASTSVTFGATGNASTQVNALQFRDLGNAGAPISFSAPTAITTADATLGALAGTIVSAADFGAGTTTVTLTGGKTITFDGTGANAAAIGGNGTFTGAFSGNTGNSAFNSVLNGANYDSAFNNTKQITLSGLTTGQQYSVQLFALDDRGGQSSRTLTFSDFSGDSTSSITEGSNNYVLGTFTALSSFETITENLPNNGNINALVVRSLTAAPEPSALSSLAFGVLGLAGLILSARRRGLNTAAPLR